MEQNDLRYLVKLAGKVLFVTGLIICMLMMLSGFWPSLLVLLMMLAGAGMVSFNSLLVKRPRLTGLKTALSRVSVSAIIGLLKRTVVVLLVFIIAGLLFLWVSQDYFKKRDTRNDCRQITKALQHYYNHEHKYPGNLSEIIDKYPLRQGWKRDYWNNNYAYIITGDAQVYTLISPGKDRRLNTGDDLVFASNKTN